MSKKDLITTKLTDHFQPSHLEVIDESSVHAGHNGHTGRDETHFKISLVSHAFEEQSLIQRHRMVYDLLKSNIEGGIHALTIRAYSPEEKFIIKQTNQGAYRQ